MQDISRASIRELAHIIKRYDAPRFAFFLGAGASRQSGIPTAGEMLRHFKEQIAAQSCPASLQKEEEKAKWLSEQAWYQADGSEYCKCFERFEPKEIGRQRYIESIVENREPSFGYVVLANLMARGLINTIITTNFDDLVYSACTTFTGIRPIVYAYGVMASEMRLTAQRPKILKLHGDYLYSALKNTGPELAAQEPNMARQLRQVLSEYGLIVVGYAGGDASVMEILADISERNDLYWCVRRGEKVNPSVEKLLRDKGGYLVEIEGFDEMMNEVRRVVEFDVQKMLGSIEDRRNQIIKHLERFEPHFSADILGDIVDAVKEPEARAGEERSVSALEYFVRAYKAQETKDFPKAEELYLKAVERNPNFAAAYDSLGLLLSELKRYDEAEAAHRRAIELDPSLARTYNNLGLLLSELKRYDEAEEAFRKALKLDPGSDVAYDNLGGLFRELKRYDEAEAAHRRAIELDPSDAVNYNGLGLVLCDLKRYGEAEEVFRRATELKPDYTIAFSNLGFTLHDMKREEEAEAAFRRAVELSPDDSVFHDSLGFFLRTQKRYEEAEAAHRRATELDPANDVAYHNLGIILSDRERYEEAEAAFRKAIELSPGDGSSYDSLGFMLMEIGRYEGAEAAFRKAVELSPEYAEAHYNLSVLLSILGRTEEALDSAEAARRLAPDSSAHLVNLASVHRTLGREAESALYVAQARESLEQDDWYNLACLEAVCGNTDAAIGHLGRAVEQNKITLKWMRLDPDLRWVRDDPRFEAIVGG